MNGRKRLRIQPTNATHKVPLMRGCWSATIAQEQHYMEHRRVRFTHRGLHRQIMVRKAHPTYTFATELIDEKPFSRKGAKKYNFSEGPKTAAGSTDRRNTRIKSFCRRLATFNYLAINRGRGPLLNTFEFLSLRPLRETVFVRFSPANAMSFRHTLALK